MIKKAVIPAAGFGSRFLPATKAQPKEMLPIIDTPTIQYVIEETVKSGVSQILLITGKGKQAIENHFDRSFELEADLARKNKQKQLREVQAISSMAELFYIRQKELNGLGDAIRYARNFVGNEPFVVLLGDTIVKSNTPCVRQLIDAYNQHRAPIIGVEEVPEDKVERYGIVKGTAINDSVFRVSNLIEKPATKLAPSRLAIGGRYILTPKIFDYLEHTKAGKGGEIQLTDALRDMCKQEEILAFKFEGKRYDIGNKLDYLITEIEFGIERDDLGYEFRQFLKDFVNDLD
ncbi:UTP--glucose-1-phosphate uridylyltransferase [candidate division KSB3 bacterium]|uniref:UTP--glucose-1-phosphate uridylyltransferase n=1 Tax=candidate division KSB3 bacterium TaxID=2044937 RepID=A0A2G6KLM7_9BACT|nr:MAG: UTP--glucose-1-phosphate uridylyltransferase [candidate division KSB3 bacterium]